MTDYYDVLGIKRTATASEIKSAYRKLARKRHPDVNRGSEKAAREFALLSLAYHTLIDPQERAFHDQQLSKQRNGNSILESDNPHAQRARNIAAQARWDRVVDQILETDRREKMQRQRAREPANPVSRGPVASGPASGRAFSPLHLQTRRPPLFDHAGRGEAFAA